MEPAAVRLKRLRESADPRLTIRGLAQALGMPASSYAFYEDASKAKKPYLPASFTRSLIEPFKAHGIDVAQVLELGGIEPKLIGSPTARDDADLPSAEIMAGHLDLVPIESIDLEYGLGSTFVDGHVEVEVLQFPRLWIESFTRTPSNLLTFARGRGDSMMPTIHSNDMVMIDRSQRTIAEPDAIWAYTVGDMGGIKRLRPRGSRIQILSDNPNVPPDEIAAEEMRIVGRVILVIKSI